MNYKINNPYYCRCCNKEYDEKESDINSNKMQDYCRYMGFCCEDCCESNNMGLIRTREVYENGAYIKRLKQYIMNLKKKK